MSRIHATLGASEVMRNFYQVNDNSDYAGVLNKTAVLNEVGRIVTLAYENGATLEEVRAICGAAYGDWDESQNLGEIEEPFFSKERVKDF